MSETGEPLKPDAVITGKPEEISIKPLTENGSAGNPSIAKSTDVYNGKAEGETIANIPTGTNLDTEI